MSGIEALIAASAAEGVGAGAALGTGITAGTTTAVEMGLGTGLTGIASASPFLEAPIAASMASPAAQAAGISLGSGILPSASMAAGTAAGLTVPQALQIGRMGLQGAQLLNQQGQRSSVSPPQMNRGREVTLAAPVQGLLQTQPMRRKKEMLSLL